VTGGGTDSGAVTGAGEVLERGVGGCATGYVTGGSESEIGANGCCVAMGSTGACVVV